MFLVLRKGILKMKSSRLFVSFVLFINTSHQTGSNFLKHLHLNVGNSVALCLVNCTKEGLLEFYVNFKSATRRSCSIKELGRTKTHGISATKVRKQN